jgi:hypothetical protein
MLKPLGGLSSTWVVVAPSFSVGTASVYTWLSPFSTTGGLMCACANAAPGSASAAVTTTTVMDDFTGCLLLMA